MERPDFKMNQSESDEDWTDEVYEWFKTEAGAEEYSEYVASRWDEKIGRTYATELAARYWKQLLRNNCLKNGKPTESLWCLPNVEEVTLLDEHFDFIPTKSTKETIGTPGRGPIFNVEYVHETKIVSQLRTLEWWETYFGMDIKSGYRIFHYGSGEDTPILSVRVGNFLVNKDGEIVSLKTDLMS